MEHQQNQIQIVKWSNPICEARCLERVRKKFEVKMMFQLTRPIVRQIKEKSFLKPSKKLLRSNKKSSEEVMESVSTADSSEEEEGRLKSLYDQLIRQEIANGELKIRVVLETFSKFEETIYEAISPSKVEILRSELFSMLGKVLEERVIYEAFSPLKLSISMLFCSINRIGLKANQFLLLIKRITKNPFSTKTELRNSTCFKAVKRLFICP